MAAKHRSAQTQPADDLQRCTSPQPRILLSCVEDCYGDRHFVAHADLSNDRRFRHQIPLRTDDGIKFSSLDREDPRRTSGDCTTIARPNIVRVHMIINVTRQPYDFTPAIDPETQAREDADASAPLVEITGQEPEPNPATADAWRRSFGTRPRKQLRPATQDDLFDPNPQRRLF